MTPVAVITGASAGIGAELARVFAGHGHSTVLVARRADKLAALSAEIAAAGHPVSVALPIDLERAGSTERIGEALAARDLEPKFIVNSAGFGLVGRAAELSLAEQLAMIELNMRALTDLSLAFVDSLARHRGGLLNVASVAGFFPGPGSAIYYASKAYVLSLTEALHGELTASGIRVTCLCPGPVATEFQARAGVPGKETGWPLAVSARRVAEAGYRGLMSGQRIVVPGIANRLVASLVPRLVPQRVLLAVLEKRQNQRRA